MCIDRHFDVWTVQVIPDLTYSNYIKIMITFLPFLRYSMQNLILCVIYSVCFNLAYFSSSKLLSSLSVMHII